MIEVIIDIGFKDLYGPFMVVFLLCQILCISESRGFPRLMVGFKGRFGGGVLRGVNLDGGDGLSIDTNGCIGGTLDGHVKTGGGCECVSIGGLWFRHIESIDAIVGECMNSTRSFISKLQCFL